MKNLFEKKLKKTDYIIIILIGVLILIIAVPTGSKISAKESEANAEMTSEEEKLRLILENMEGVGKVNVMISTDESNEGMFSSEKLKVQGVVIVAEGAENPKVKQNILDVIMALFDVKAHKIKIVKKSL